MMPPFFAATAFRQRLPLRYLRATLPFQPLFQRCCRHALTMLLPPLLHGMILMMLILFCITLLPLILRYAAAAMLIRHYFSLSPLPVAAAADMLRLRCRMLPDTPCCRLAFFRCCCHVMPLRVAAAYAAMR